MKIVGFGTFVVTNRAAGEARNPRTGEKVKVPASKTPKFRAGAGLKDAVNSNNRLARSEHLHPHGGPTALALSAFSFYVGTATGG